MTRLAAQSSLFVPPGRFRAASGVRWARFCDREPFVAANGVTPAQKHGKRFERRALSTLMEEFIDLRFRPWIRFEDSKCELRHCQPDGLLEHEDRVYIFEVKAQHCIEAYWQLRRLYVPVVAHIFPNHDVVPVEVVKSFDPAVPWPEPIDFTTRTQDILGFDGGFVVLWLTR